MSKVIMSINLLIRVWEENFLSRNNVVDDMIDEMLDETLDEMLG